MTPALRILSCAWLLTLAACASPPPPAPVAPAGPAPEAMVATIRAAAGPDRQELNVQPLRDTMVEDLRRQAAELERKHLYRAAADALDRAIAIQPEDPALLQERAEAAVLLRDFEGAETLAQRAYAQGAQVGPLCRRHWATIEQVRKARGDDAGAAEARTKLDACTVAPPPRY
jgi:hypothetical protein